MIRLLQFRLRDFAAVLWRPVLACLVMAAAMHGTAHEPSGTYVDLPSLVQLLLLVAVGAATFIATALLSWRLTGRPPGAESTLLDLIGSRLRRRSTAT
jgi:PST family polysaccharide transporter